MTLRRVRIGIDVGGTFTKAVALDVKTGVILSKFTVPTTHQSANGVSDGIIQALRNIIDSGIDPAEVEIISHSTTQAINALLESDTSCVGIISMGVSAEKRSIINRTNLSSINDSAFSIESVHTFLDTSHLITEDEVSEIISNLKSRGAQVIVASEAFSVDDPSNESFVMDIAKNMGIPATASHELSGVYGLEIRTLTSAINASVLPKTFQVANFVENAISQTGIPAPLLIMKGDGGATSMDTFRNKPILTILSGPAASISGALLYLKVVDGIFIEVGGTSTNICVIKDGKPQFSYVRVNNYPTCIRSMDVRIMGVAGGSMIQLFKNHIQKIGPRSAHIAGLKYSCFADIEDIRTGKIIMVHPHGDTNDYVAIQCDNSTYAITNTCAANALGLINDNDYSKSNTGSAIQTMKILAKFLDSSYTLVAMSILQTSSFEITKAVTRILKDYSLDTCTTRIIGGGGGASVLAPFVAKQLGMSFELAEHADVISSIGVALSMLREEFEYTLSNPTSAQISDIQKQAYKVMTSRGAVPESIMISSDYITDKSLLRVTAVGNVAMDSSETSHNVFTKPQLLERASNLSHIDPLMLKTIFESEHYTIYTSLTIQKRLFLKEKRNAVIVIDKFGHLKHLLKHAKVFTGTPDSILKQFDVFMTSLSSDIAPQTIIVDSFTITDYSSITSKQQLVVAVKDYVSKSNDFVLIIHLNSTFL